MKKIRVAIVPALLAGSLLVAGSSASAHSVVAYCGHGTAPSSVWAGHNKVTYEASNGTGSYHAHKYKHDVSWGSDHHPWQGC